MADIAESVRRVLKEEYILYHLDHYNLIVPGRTDECLSPIWQKSNSNLREDMLSSQVQAIVRFMETKGEKAAGPLEIAEALEGGQLLEELLEAIAGALDSGIQSAWSSSDPSSFAQVLQSSHSLDGLFENGRVKAKQVQEFFDLVVKGIQAMTGGTVPKHVFTQLTKIGKKMGPSSFRYSKQGYDTVTPVTKEQLQVIDNILTWLNNAADKLNKNGSLTSESLRSTMTNVFSGALGEQIGKQMIESAMPNLDNEILNISEQVLGKNGNIKLISTSFEKTGAKKTNGKTAKVDLLNNDALSLSLSINGQVTNIEIATNISVKWYKTNAQGIVPHVSLGSMNMGDILKEFALAPRGIAYNIVAHQWGDNEGYQKLRSTISASFLNEWISGSGGLMSTGQVDKAQMLMVNGKLYTITGIIKKIAEKIPYGKVGGIASPVTLSFGDITQKENKWVGSAKNWDDAEERSRMVQGIINGLTISATLNMNMLGLT